MKINPSDNNFEQEREKLHRTLLTSVSHDLKTPLACIIGSLEIFERTKDKLSPEKQAILIKTALKEAHRLDGFITNILDMAKLESGTIQLKKQMYEMDLLLADCHIVLGHRLGECEVSIKAIPSPFPIHTDFVLLMRAICIVLDNAAKYCTINKGINIEYEKVGEMVEVRIEDNGPGIPETKMEEIFSKYTRYAKEDYQQAGTGLGLPICREIMRLLGGTVSVTNREGGKGAIFTLAFPA